jgi:hypothetical protein
VNTENINSLGRKNKSFKPHDRGEYKVYWQI